MGGLGPRKPGIASSNLAWGTYLLFYVVGGSILALASPFFFFCEIHTSNEL